MPTKLVTPTHGLFSPNGEYVSPYHKDGDKTVSVNGIIYRSRPLVYYKTDKPFCAGCRGRRSRTKFDVKPASNKGRTICSSCGRMIHDPGKDKPEQMQPLRSHLSHGRTPN